LLDSCFVLILISNNYHPFARLCPTQASPGSWQLAAPHPALAGTDEETTIKVSRELTTEANFQPDLPLPMSLIFRYASHE